MTTMTTAPAWGANYDRMSPAVRARCMADDREFRQAQAAQERERAARETYLDEQRIRSAMELAEQRGEYVSVAEVARTGGACLGRTRSEFIEYTSAMQDVEDAKRAHSQPPAVDTEQYAALQLAVSPTGGRTRREAVAYYSALADLQDIEAARRAQQGPAAPDAVAARQAQQDKQTARYESRARDRHVQVVARGAAQRALRDHYEEQFHAGHITEAQLREAGRTLK